MAGSKKFGLELVIGALDNAAKPLQDLNNRLNGLQAPIKRLRDAFGRLDRAAGLQRIRRSMREVGRATGNLMRVVGGLGRALVGLFLLQGAAGLFFQRFIIGAARSADELAKLSTQTGVSIDAIQTLGFAAQRVGVTQEQFNAGVSRFTKTMGELQAGSGSLFTMLQRVDPQFLRVLQRTEGTEEAMRLFIDRMRDIPSEAGRVALATAVFGRSAGNMANLAKLSAEELAGLEGRMRQIGLISPEQAKNAENFTDQLLEVRLAFQQIRNVMAAEFLPTLTDLFKQFTELLIENRPAMQDFAKTMVERLPEGIRRVRIALEAAMRAFSRVFEMMRWLNDRGLTFERVLIGLATVIGIKVVLAVAALAKALVGLGLAIATTPIGLLVVGLSGLAFAIKQVIDNWEMMVEYFSGLSARELFGEFLKGINLMINPAKLLLAVLENIAFTSNLISGLKSNLSTLAQSIPGVRNLFGSNGDDREAASVGAATIAAPPQSITRDANITVTMQQLQPGTRVSVDGDRELGIDLDLQFLAFGGFSR